MFQSEPFDHRDPITPARGDPVPVFMKYSGVRGTAALGSETGLIELKSFQFGIGRGIGTPIGKAKERESTSPTITDIGVTKVMDNTSANFYQLARSSDGRDKVTIYSVEPLKPGKAPVINLKCVLEDVMITTYSVSSYADLPTESITLSFLKITFVTGSPGIARNVANRSDRVA
jgi:type VI secretion system secreted protein Hcp